MSTAAQLPNDWKKAWDHVDRAVHAARTDTAYRKQSPMFIFVREMQGFPWAPEYRDDPEEIADLIQKMHTVQNDRFRQWMRIPAGERLEECDFWLFYEPQLRGTREEFIALWLSMRWRPDEDPLRTAFDESIEQPLRAQEPPSKIYAQLLTIAYRLQLHQGGRYITLPQERIAKLLNVSQRTVSAYIGLAERKGLLRVVSEYNHQARLAKRYFFNLERVKNGAIGADC